MSECSFDWCTNSDAGHKEHMWTDGVDASSILGKLRHVSVWNSIHEGFSEPILIGIEAGPDEVDDGYEAWLSIDQAVYLRDTLTKAIENASGGTD